MWFSHGVNTMFFRDFVPLSSFSIPKPPPQKTLANNTHAHLVVSPANYSKFCYTSNITDKCFFSFVSFSSLHHIVTNQSCSFFCIHTSDLCTLDLQTCLDIDITIVTTTDTQQTNFPPHQLRSRSQHVSIHRLITRVHQIGWTAVVVVIKIKTTSSWVT